MTVHLVEHCLFRHADDPAVSDRVALVFAGESGLDEEWTYARIADAVRRFAWSLVGIGLARGERLLVRLDNSTDYAIAFFGACAAGLVPIPASPQLTDEEVRFLLVDSGAAAIVVAAEWASRLGTDVPDGLRHVIVAAAKGQPTLVEEWPHAPSGPARHDFHAILRDAAPVDLPDVGGDDPAYLIYTSGTSSRPKGVLHAHRSILGRAFVVREWEALLPTDRVFHAGALNWTYTLGVGLMDPWSVGATSILYAGPRRPQTWLPIIERLGITVFAAVPTVFRQILKYVEVEDCDLSSLRHALTAGETLLPQTWRDWVRRTGKELYEALGMSEISTYISFRPGLTVKPGACGVPQAGRPIRLVAMDSLDDAPVGTVGRIAVHRSDPGLMLGYWNRPDEDRAAFCEEWFIGGDTAHIDEDGIWWFDGRNDDVMTSFGYRVSPQEIESVLSTHRHVAECAVRMIPTGEAGVELIAAFVKPREDAVLDVASLERHAHRQLAAYKCPRVFFAVDEIPRTPSGKILRRDLCADRAIRLSE